MRWEEAADPEAAARRRLKRWVDALPDLSLEDRTAEGWVWSGQAWTAQVKGYTIRVEHTTGRLTWLWTLRRGGALRGVGEQRELGAACAEAVRCVDRRIKN